MIRKAILWTVFFLISIICIVWFAVLISNTAKKEKMRYGVARLRAERAGEMKGPIIVGVAGSAGLHENMFRGIEIARGHVNDAGGVLGREIRTVVRDDKGSVITGRQIAQEFSDNLDMAAVIGHSDSSISVPVSVIYQYYGLLMISPLSKNSKLTASEHNLIFRNIPSDTDIGYQMAEYAHRKGYRKMAIYYLKDMYGMGMSSSFENKAVGMGITIVDRICYESAYTRKEFSSDARQWKKFYSFDAIFLAGRLPQAAVFLSEARRAGIHAPVIAEEGLEGEELLKVAGDAAEGTVVMSVFDAGDPDPSAMKFRESYRERYGSFPDGRAAQGYDAFVLLARSMKAAKSTVPEKVAKVLGRTRDYRGVTGSHTFNGSGDVVNKKLLKKRVKDGRFVLVE